MTEPLILASASPIRARLLRGAGLDPQAIPARIDEESVKTAMLAEGAPPRDLADTLATLKADKLSRRHPEALVIGCDQVLSLDGTVLSKPESREDAREQLLSLSGRDHRLFSAVVVTQASRVLWRHVAPARLWMHDLSPEWIEGYLTQAWPGVSDSVGAYKLEESGAWLFSRIEGDSFTI